MYHDRKYFYKYVTAETARKILQNRKLKYSSPVIFNDPFDVQTRVDYGFKISEMLEAFYDELDRLVHGDNEPVGDVTYPLFNEILKARETYKKTLRRMPKHFFDKKRKAGDDYVVKRTKKFISDFNSYWKKFVKASRVFSVSEENDNLLMWAHYAKDHTGAVIKFECLRELDTVLCIARKVDYLKEPPTIAKLDEYLQYITGQDRQILNHNLLMSKLFLTKSEHWSYEREWRVFKPPLFYENPIIRKDSKGEEIFFDLEPFYPQEIHSIYFGCKMDGSIRQNIEKKLTADFGHVQKYLCQRNEKKYKLDFELIK